VEVYMRRVLVSVSIMLFLLSSLVACGDDDGGDGAGTNAGDGAAGWTYLDGSGKTTTLAEVPVRIVAHGAAAAALIPLGIRPVGIYADTAVEDDLALKNLDLEGIAIVGEEWGVINIEAVAALRPDLIVAEWWPVERAYSGLEAGTAAASQQLLEIAPIVGVAQGPSILQMIEDYEGLAESLGADLSAPAIAAPRERLEAALATFRSVVEAKPDLSVLAVSPTVDTLYVAVPEHAAELSDFASWGLDLIVPDTPDEGFEYWESLSWENADKYQADLLIIDERGYPANLAQVEAQPTWKLLDAAAAGAVAVWPAYWLRNFTDYAVALDQLAASIEQADEHLVD
jgi:iron complex transport system substrate-binding protein